MLKESRDAVERELKAQSTVMVQNIEEAAQQRAESNALRYVCVLCILIKRLFHWAVMVLLNM